MYIAAPPRTVARPSGGLGFDGTIIDTAQRQKGFLRARSGPLKTLSKHTKAMARGRRTDPTAAVLARVLHEMGFDAGIIVEVTRLARGTVNDIVQGHGRWAQMPQNELFERTRERVGKAIENAADGLAMETIDRLEKKLSEASLMETLGIYQALISTRRLAG